LIVGAVKDNGHRRQQHEPLLGAGPRTVIQKTAKVDGTSNAIRVRHRRALSIPIAEGVHLVSKSGRLKSKIKDLRFGIRLAVSGEGG
jgi:hypothetical protein